jgi:hypothetical protein
MGLYVIHVSAVARPRSWAEPLQLRMWQLRMARKSNLALSMDAALDLGRTKRARGK